MVVGIILYEYLFFVTDLIAIYIVGILIAWRLIGFATLLYPVKMLAVAYHEFWHILVGVCAGHKLEKVDLDPTLGGKTVFDAPEAPIVSLQPYACYFVSLFLIRFWKQKGKPEVDNYRVLTYCRSQWSEMHSLALFLSFADLIL